jgi:hypothetical protein
MHKLVAAVAALGLLTATLPAAAAPVGDASTQGAATSANTSMRTVQAKKPVKHAKRHGSKRHLAKPHGLKYAKHHRLHHAARHSRHRHHVLAHKKPRHARARTQQAARNP